jgi:hypothetical protein
VAVGAGVSVGVGGGVSVGIGVSVGVQVAVWVAVAVKVATRLLVGVGVGADSPAIREPSEQPRDASVTMEIRNMIGTDLPLMI